MGRVAYPLDQKLYSSRKFVESSEERYNLQPT